MNDGEKYVAKFKAKTTKSLNTIANNPYLYAVADPANDVRKCVLHNNYSVFYKIQDQYIMILFLGQQASPTSIANIHINPQYNFIAN